MTGPDEPSLESQCGMILAHMKGTETQEPKSITGLEALRRYGCIHLPRRILDLKERGHDIKCQWIRVGEKRCKEYWIERQA